MQPLHPTDPARIGRYRLTHRLGAGGMGRVYLALTPASRRVAVKVILAEYAEDPDFRARFTREVEAARRVGGFHTAQLVDAEPDAASPWIATAYVPGPSLERTVRDHGPLAPPALHALAAGLAEGLEAIHSCGLTHRDLKPDNIILGADGPRIIDFGIARAPDSVKVTRTGMPVGTPSYMSPEQTEGVPVGPASDMFSLGTVLAYAATGDNPFAGPSLASVVRRLIGPAPDPDGIPTEELRSLVLSCWQHDPDRRPSPAEALSRFEDTDLSDAWPPSPLVDLVKATAEPMSTEVLTPLSPTLVATAVPRAVSETLAALEERARGADEAEEPRAALLAHRALHVERLRVLGPHHPDTLATRGEALRWEATKWDDEDTLHAYEALLTEMNLVLGPEHLETLATRRRHAHRIGLAEDHHSALRLLEPLLRDQIHAWGPDHPQTLMTRGRILYWRGEAGEHAGTLHPLRALLEDMLRVLGPEHRETLQCLSDIAGATGRAGDLEGAVKAYQAALKEHVRVLGPDHPRTLDLEQEYALCLGDSGDTEGAVLVLRRLLGEQCRVLGPDHPGILLTRHNIAVFLSESADPRAALRSHEELLAERIRLQGVEHPESLSTRFDVAYWKGENGDDEGALSAFRALGADYARVLGPHHPDTLLCRQSTAFWLGKTGDFRGAVEALRSLEEECSRVFGPDHERALKVREDLAYWRRMAIENPPS